MLQKQKNKAQAAEEELEVEVITKVEVIHEYTKAITGVEPEYKFGQVYRMISTRVFQMLALKICPYMQNLTIHPL